MYSKIIYNTLLSVFVLSVLIFSSCRKVNQTLVDGEYPNQRVSEFMGEVKQELLGADNGWAGYMYIPQNKRGYTFYMKFKDTNRVVMYADFVDSTAITPKESSFTLRNTELPSLIFDTYNYIHLPADPKKDVNGGESGEGLYSDFEYSIIRVTEDTIYLEGNFNGCELKLVRLNDSEWKRVKEGKLKDKIDQFKDFFAIHRNNYMTLDDNRKLGIGYSNGTRQVSYQILENDGSVSSHSSTFFYSVDGLVFNDDYQYGGTRFTQANINNGVLTVKDSSGDEFDVKQDSIPVTPLPASFSYDGTYNSIVINGETLPSGISSGWNQIYQHLVDRFHGTSHHILTFEFVLINDSKVRINIPYLSSNGHSYTADAQFDYVRDGDEITLSNFVPSITNGNWNTRSHDIGDLVDYFKGRTFKIDWVAGSGQSILGGLYPVDAPDDYFYGVLE